MTAAENRLVTVEGYQLRCMEEKGLVAVVVIVHVERLLDAGSLTMSHWLYFHPRDDDEWDLANHEVKGLREANFQTPDRVPIVKGETVATSPEDYRTYAHVFDQACDWLDRNGTTIKQIAEELP